MSASLTMLGAKLGSVQSEAKLDTHGILLTVIDNKSNHFGVFLSNAEAAKIMADLATALGLIEAPKVAA